MTLEGDSHKRTHTVVAVDGNGRQLGSRTAIATSAGHLELLRWAEQWPERRWALEDCRREGEPVHIGSSAHLPVNSCKDHAQGPSTAERTASPSCLVALVRAGAKFENGKLVERPDESGGDQQAA